MSEVMPKSFPWREQWNTPETGFLIEVRHPGHGRIDGFNCQCYDEYQWIPGRSRYLIATINAPYCDLK